MKGRRRRGVAACAVAGLMVFSARPLAIAGDVSYQVANGTREAYALPFVGLDENELQRFRRGRALFRQAWIVAPARDDAVDGLGPLYNRLTCIACHPNNGRGRAPDGPDERMLSMLVRLSVAGKDVHGGPRPHPVYGEQLNEEGIPGVPGEGRAALSWQAHSVELAGGERVILRKPVVRFRELGYGELGAVMISPRVGPPVHGLGLLDAVPDEELEAIAREPKPDGVRGKVNRVWSLSAQRVVAGRFGLKANMPDLRQQIAGAMLGDLGITSSLFSQQNCTASQVACRAAPDGGQPELSDSQLDDIEFYFAHLAVPSRRHVDTPEVARGEALFASAGCAHCHRPTLRTGAHPRFPRLSDKVIAAYTDLLVHDMGEGLADGRPDFDAGGREWRTPPLWGIGLTERVNDHSEFLHDGRARNLTEAILWHGGEAQTARDRFARLLPADREAVLAFLRSL